MVLRRDNIEISNSDQVPAASTMDSLLSPNPKRNWDPYGIVRSIRILASGFFILYLGWRWWSPSYTPITRYIQAVYVLLFLMAWGVIRGLIERSIIYAMAHHQSRNFARQVARALGDHDFDQAIAIAGRYRRNPAAKLVESGLASFQAATPLLADAEVIETTQHAMRRTAKLVHGEMKRGLALLASIATTAPLVGSYGAVLGIIYSFRGTAADQYTDLANIAEGLADALLIIEWSLLLGVLAMWCRNYLNSKLRTLDMEMENESVKLLNYLVIHLERQRLLPDLLSTSGCL